MKTKGSLILGIVFLGLLLFYNFQYSQEEINPEKEFPSFSVQKKEEVKQIILEEGDKEVVLDLIGGKWMVGNIIASQGKVEEVLDAFSDIKISELISEKEEKQDLFEVSDDKAKKISFGGDKKIFIGKSSAGGGVFVRREGSNKIFLADNYSLKFAFDVNDDFREKKILNLDKEKITQIVREGEKEEEKLEIKKEGDSWKVIQDDFSSDPAKVEDFVSKVANLQTESFADRDKEKDYGFNLAKLSIRVNTDDGKEKVVRFVPWSEGEDNKFYNVELEGNFQTVFAVKAENVDEFKKNVEEFRLQEEGEGKGNSNSLEEN